MRRQPVPLTPEDLVNHQFGTDDNLIGTPGAPTLFGDAGGNLFDFSKGATTPSMKSDFPITHFMVTWLAAFSILRRAAMTRSTDSHWLVSLPTGTLARTCRSTVRAATTPS